MVEARTTECALEGQASYEGGDAPAGTALRTG